jgi:catechol 2,3-dioxygenase-like lactoylglutathione lyase family enzyme
MAWGAITHVALRVATLREAEGFYCALFGLAVAFRETKTVDGWRTLPCDKTWDDATPAGVVPGLSLLYRDQFVLALSADSDATPGGRLDHLGVLVPADDLTGLRTHAPRLGCEIVVDQPSVLVFDDPLEVRWELTTTPYVHPPTQSAGARHGRWLAL